MHNTLNKIVDEMLERDTRRKREARVSAVRQVTTRIRRITLSGDDVDKFIADPRAQEPVGSRCSSRGATRWPGGPTP